jgi:DNA-binding transcriptional LysR family regulator
MRNLTLRQLRAFETLAEYQSFTAAAEALHVTQPTLSMQIKKLGEAAGVPLYEQVGKRIFLTEAGKALLATSREIFASLGRYEMAVSKLQGLERGRLQISAVTTTEYFAPRVLGAFSTLHPGIQVSLKLANRESLLERLAANMDDLYIMGQPPKELDIESVPILDNPLEIVAAPSHPLAGKRRISLERLLEENFILRESGSGTRTALERHLNAHGLMMKSSLELGSNEAIKQGVLGGLGVAVLSRYVLIGELTHGELALLPVAGFPLESHWYLVYPRGKQLSSVAQAFSEFLATEGRALLNKVKH